MHRWVLFLALLVPSASANLCVEWVDVDWRGADADIKHGLLYFGNPARDLRQDMDADGNTFVSTSEVTAYEERLAASASGCADEFRLMEVDGERPKSISVSFAVDAAGDSSASRENLQAAVTVEATWAQRSGPVEAEIRYAETLNLAQVASCVDGGLESWFWSDHWCGQSSSDGVQAIDHLGIRGSHLRSTIDPSGLASAWDDGEFRFTGSQADAARSQAVVVSSEFPDASGSSLPVAGTVTGLTLAALGLAYAWEPSRVRIWRWLGMLGFTRIRGDEALRNEHRQAILDLVRDEPGQSFTDIRRRLGLGNGAAVHHLRVLEREGFIQASRDGLRVRYVPAGMPLPSTPYLTDVQRVVWSAIAEQPGRSQMELAQALGLPRATVRYNANVLHRHGLVRVEREGNHKRHYPATRQ